MVKKVAGQIMEKGDEQLEGVILKPGKVVGKMAESEHGKNVGSWAFMIGFLIALIAGVIAGLNAAQITQIDLTVTAVMTGLLVMIGIIVGIVNVSGKDSVAFLVATIAIMSGSAGFSALSALSLGVVAAFLSALIGMIAVFVAPAAIIVALKVIYSTARKA